MNDEAAKPSESSDDALESKVYASHDGHTLGMKDLLEFFHQRGTLRVSDLHLKVGCPPTYRVDGRLQKTKGPPLDNETVESLLRGLLTSDDVARLKSDRSADSSYISDALQFRLNCFYDNDGLAAAIRALDQSPPPVEKIGFTNQVWRDIVQLQQGLVLITGITGAGKSTTIASLINHIAQERPCRIITLEDPNRVSHAKPKGIAVTARSWAGCPQL